MTSVLSSSIETMRGEYDVVIVGSGYGGGIAASRLSRAGMTVCVLERGSERQPGDYPANALSLLEEIQLDTPVGKLGSDLGLFDMRYNDSVNVVVGCGLGGTSLINAGICLRPAPAVFANGNWPVALQAETALAVYFDRAEAMLKPSPNPAAFLASAKTQALQAAAAAVGKTAAPVSVLVNFQPLPDDKNHVGVTQLPCIGCGDCVSGCNHRAKSTVIMNYLPDAKNHGAAIFTRTRARYVEPAGSSWIVQGETVGGDSGTTAFQVKGGLVILAAGTLGSTELLLRSRENGLAVSHQLGSRFSANGDMIGFAYNTGHDINGIGLGSSALGDRPPIGPCSTVMVDWRHGATVRSLRMAPYQAPYRRSLPRRWRRRRHSSAPRRPRAYGTSLSRKRVPPKAGSPAPTPAPSPTRCSCSAWLMMTAKDACSCATTGCGWIGRAWGISRSSPRPVIRSAGSRRR